jgi:Protein of unknown function (DUF1524)
VHAFRRAALSALAALTLATGCGPGTLDPGGSAGAGPAASPGPGAGSAAQQLAALTVAGWLSMAGYSRDKFPHWIQQGGGCDTRDVVLQRQGTGVRTGGSCKITAGQWTSPYDGRSYTDPQRLQIDHMVPLANAWRSGASRWTTQQRQDFANDLSRPQLLAVTGTVNEAKGDQDPSQWKPPSHAFWCGYAQDWIAVKAAWQLTVTAAEKAALTDMLGACP